MPIVRFTHGMPHADSDRDGRLPPVGASRSRPLGTLNILSRQADTTELLDHGGHDHGALRGTFRDMLRVNRWLGGTRITLRGVERLTGQVRTGECLSILDIGTGHGDIPAAVMRWGQAQSLRPLALGLEIDLATLRSKEGASEVMFAAGDGRQLPLQDKSVDIAMSSMTFHHFTDDDAVIVLREMARVSRLGFIVNDLMPTLHGYVVAWLLARVATRNRLTRSDAHVSIRRSRTRDELAELADRAGLNPPVFDSVLGYRTAMTVGVRSWR